MTSTLLLTGLSLILLQFMQPNPEKELGRNKKIFETEKKPDPKKITLIQNKPVCPKTERRIMFKDKLKHKTQFAEWSVFFWNSV